VRFIVADDHALVREGLALSLKNKYPDSQVIELEDGSTLMAELERESSVALILLDLRMPNTRPFELLKAISTKWPLIKLVVLSASENQHDVDKAFDNGARGFIPKSTATPTLLAVIDQILMGKVYVPKLPEIVALPVNYDDINETTPKLRLPSTVTRRQIDVLALLVQGKTNREIAQELKLSECTIKIHVANLFKSFEVSNRTEVVIKARRYHIPRG